MTKTHFWKYCFYGSLATLLGAPFSAEQSWGQSRTETIVTTGDAAPDGNGFFGFLGQARLNNSGQISFTSTSMTGTQNGTIDEVGVFRAGAGGLIQIERSSNTVLSLGGTHINDLGHVAYGFVVSGGAFLDPRNGIRIWDGQNLQTVAVESAGAGQEVFAISGFNNSDQVAFQQEVNSLRSIIRAESGGTVSIVGEFQAAPGGSGSFTNFSLASNLRTLNEAGQVAFYGDISGSAATNQGIFRGNGASLDQIARKGQLAPDGNGVFSNFNEFSGPQYSINDLGQVVFSATLSGTSGGTTDSRGLFIGDGNSTSQILRSGQASPDGNGSFLAAFSPHLNNSGQVAFLGVMAENDGGIFQGSTQGVTKIARTGDVAFDGIGFFSANYRHLAQNDAGQTAFVASTASSPGASPDGEALFTSDGIDALTVVRFGDSLSGSTVNGIGDSSGAPLALNRHGQIAYRVQLADGRDMIQLWTPDLHWRSNSSGSWDQGSNWTLGLNVAEVHDVYIDPNLSLVVTGPSNDANVRNLTIGGGGGTATFVMNGSELAIAAGAGNSVTVLSNGVLAGNGQINGQTQVFGTLAPGESAGHLSFQGNLFLNEPSLLAIEIGGIASNQFDRFTVFDDLFLDGSIDVSLIGGHVLGANDFYLIGEVGGNLTGQFNGLSEGDLVGTFGGRNLFITYTAGNGNDIGLFTAIPEPAYSLALMALVAGTIGCSRNRKA